MRIRNARIVTLDEDFTGSLCCEDGRIAGVDRGAAMAGEDWNGDWLLPGLIELHTDNLEKHMTPRPGVQWPALPAVLAHDAQLVAGGITTVLDALALGDVKPGGTRAQNLQSMLDAINVARSSGLLRADHRLHLRCELSTAGIMDLFTRLAADPALALVSLMDHTPGQRQFTDETKYREYYQGKYGLSNAQMDSFTESQKENHHLHSARNRREVVTHCRQAGIALASHDDATTEHVSEAIADGVVLSEFPTTLSAARAARAHGLSVLMGAPNVVRGGSHSGNISALELAREDKIDVLSSDYVPASLLHGAFLLNKHAGWSMAKAVASVSANPARLAGLDDRGEIAGGKRVDFVRVRTSGDIPAVISAWREGQRIL